MVKVINSSSLQIFQFLTGETRDFLNLARTYLFYPNKSHKTLFYIIAIAFTFFITCFVRYAYVEKYEITSSVFYGNLNYSFVDRSYPEIFGYSLEILSAGIFAAYAIAHKKYQWLAWTAIYLVAFTDDALQAHETAGQLLQDKYLLSDHMKEPAAFALLGITFILFWAAGLFSIPKKGKEIRTYFLFSIYFGCLIVFGVGVDAMHGYLKENYNISETIMTLAEDGVELAILCICAISVHGFWCMYKDDINWRI